MTPRFSNEIYCACGVRARWVVVACVWACGRDDTPCAFAMSEAYAAAHQVGPFARAYDPTRDFEGAPIPGFAQTGPYSYVRITEPDTKAVYHEGIVAAHRLAKRGMW